MFNEKLKKQIIEVWNSYVSNIKTEKDEEGNPINTIDDSRLYAIEVVKIIMHNFLKGDFSVHEFRNALDSYNRHNNLWGFTAKLGQMYFNQLIKANEGNLEKLTLMLKDLITEPKNLRDALSKIDTLEKFTLGIYSKSKDKHNAPYPGAAGYFLTYFWQMYNHQKWPILYNTLLSSFKELGIWEDQKTQKETYENYYRVYNEVKDTIEDVSTKIISFWDVEHAFWNYKFKPAQEPVVNVAVKTEVVVPKTQTTSMHSNVVTDSEVPPAKESININIREYIIPKLGRLLEKESSQSETEVDQEVEFDQMVVEAFMQMDFDVKIMEQGMQKNPYAILRYREENIAFIVDAVADDSLYFGSDRRTIKEYINEHCQELRKEGYKKVGYFVVCNSFESKYQDFVSYIHWNTDVKKMTLMSAEALLYLLAYKIKTRSSLIGIVDKVSALPTLVNMTNIASELGS